MANSDTQALTEKQFRFVEEYLLDLNATQAAIRAGYAEKTARQMGSENLAKPVIADAIAELMQERSEKTQVDATYVLERLKEIDQMDVIDILEDDGSLKPIREWPKVWRTSLSSMAVAEIVAGSGDDKTVASLLKSIKWPDKVKNLDLLGKHVDVGAYKERVEHSMDEELTNWLKR